MFHASPLLHDNINLRRGSLNYWHDLCCYIADLSWQTYSEIIPARGPRGKTLLDPVFPEFNFPGNMIGQHPLEVVRVLGMGDFSRTGKVQVVQA